jgi:hypothetical protein
MVELARKVKREHKEIKDQVQERLLQSEAFSKRNVGLLEPNCQQSRSRGQVQPRPALLDEKPRQGTHEPDGARERDEDTEGLGVVFRAVVRFNAFEDADHYRKNDNLAEGGDGEGHVGNAVSGQGSQEGVVLDSKEMV